MKGIIKSNNDDYNNTNTNEDNGGGDDDNDKGWLCVYWMWLPSQALEVILRYTWHIVLWGFLFFFVYNLYMHTWQVLHPRVLLTIMDSWNK